MEHIVEIQDHSNTKPSVCDICDRTEHREDCPNADIELKSDVVPMGYTHRGREYRIGVNCSVCGIVSWNTTKEQAEEASKHHIALMAEINVQNS